MADNLTPAQRSYCMSQVKGRDTAPELALRSSLHRRGHRFRKHYKKIAGSPDIAFPRRRLAVFVDGDFWHGRVLVEDGREALERSLGGERKEWWVSKIVRNAGRDQRVNTELQLAGWRVLRFWESQVKADLESVVAEIEVSILNTADREDAPQLRRESEKWIAGSL